MSQNQFEDRLNRIAAKSGTDNGNKGSALNPAKPEGNAPSFIGTMVAGVIWGVVLASQVIFTNQNYEQLKEISPSLLMALVGFILVSLFIFAIMIVAGIISLLLGRRSPKRWRFLLGVGAGFGGGAVIAQALFS